MSRRLCALLFVFLLVSLSSSPLCAQQQDDIRRLLEQRTERQAAERERALLQEEQNAERPTITIDGQTHIVEHNASDVGRALYLSLQHQQWISAARFLDEYLTLPDRDPLLVHHAQGALARINGRYVEAEREYRALLALQPDFLLARLELARVLFEDHQDREAEALFDDLGDVIDASDPHTEGVRRSVQIFRQALENRRAWSGAYSFGPTWNDNVNRTSATQICLISFEGTCYFDTRTPDAIASFGADYDASVSKRLPLVGHHGLYVRSSLFGQNYHDHSAYNELTFVTQAGYAYRSGRHNIALAPSFDYYALGNATLYGAWGMHGEWSYTLSSQSLLRLEGDWKDMRYRQNNHALNYDGVTRSVYVTYFRSLGSRWSVFGGVDVVDSDASEVLSSYLQKGARLGASLQWPDGFATTLSASYRRREYGAYSPVFCVRREDDEQNYSVILKATRWSLGGFVPLLTIRHNRVQSNVDWLYSYDKNTVSLKLERAF